jgi:hypothetical protein
VLVLGFAGFFEHEHEDEEEDEAAFGCKLAPMPYTRLYPLDTLGCGFIGALSEL